MELLGESFLKIYNKHGPSDPAKLQNRIFTGFCKISYGKSTFFAQLTRNVDAVVATAATDPVATAAAGEPTAFAVAEAPATEDGLQAAAGGAETRTAAADVAAATDATATATAAAAGQEFVAHHEGLGRCDLGSLTPKENNQMQHRRRDF